MSRRQAESLAETFADFRPRMVEGTLTDFSRPRSPEAACCQVAPRKADTVTRIVRLANERNIPLRIRAQGHSLNGSSVPSPAELLLATRNFRHVGFEEPGAVTAGSGVVLWILQYILRRYGSDLPVLNDGYPGPLPDPRSGFAPLASAALLADERAETTFSHSFTTPSSSRQCSPSPGSNTA